MHGCLNVTPILPIGEQKCAKPTVDNAEVRPIDENEVLVYGTYSILCNNNYHMGQYSTQ